MKAFTHQAEAGSAVYQLALLALSIYVLVVLLLEAFVVTDDEVQRLLQYVDLAV